MTPCALARPVKGPSASDWNVVPPYWRTIEAEAGDVHAESADLKLGGSVTARERRRRAGVDVPGHWRAGISLDPAKGRGATEQREGLLGLYLLADRQRAAAAGGPAGRAHGQRTKLGEERLARDGTANDNGVAEVATQAALAVDLGQHVELREPHRDGAEAERSALETHQHFLPGRKLDGATDVHELVADPARQAPRFRPSHRRCRSGPR